MKKSKFLYFDEVDKVRYITATERSSPPVQNHLDIVNMNSSQGRIRLLIGNTGSDERFLVDNTIISCKRNLRASAGMETNTIDTVGNADLVIKRSGTEFLQLVSTANAIQVADTSRILTPRIYTDLIACNTLGTDTVFYGSNTADNQAVEYFRFNHDNESVDFSKSVRLANTLIIDIAEKLTMRPSLEGGVNIFDIRNLHPIVDNPMIRFRVGDGAGETIVCEMTNNAVSFQRNVIVGTAYELRTNAIDTTTDNDLVFQRNGTEIFKCQTSAGIDNNDIINITPIGGGMSASNIYCNSFKNRTLTSDTVFYGLGVFITACVKPTQTSATNNFKKQQCYFETFNNF